MNKHKQTLTAMSADEASAHVMNNDISDRHDQAEVVPNAAPQRW